MRTDKRIYNNIHVHYPGVNSLLPDVSEGKDVRKVSVDGCFVEELQDDLKVTQPILKTCSVCQEVNFMKLENKTNYILCCIQRHTNLLFSSCLMQTIEAFLCHGNGSPDEIFSICLSNENREMHP